MTESWFHSYICGKAGRVLSGDLTNRSESELEKFTNFVSITYNFALRGIYA